MNDCKTNGVFVNEPFLLWAASDYKYQWISGVSRLADVLNEHFFFFLPMTSRAHAYIYIYIYICIYIYIYMCIYLHIHMHYIRLTHTHTIIYNYDPHKCTYEGHTISFQTFFVLAFRIVEDSWKFSMLLLYILWDNWPIFMTSASNEQLQQQLECTILKPDCHSWWISKMQSDTFEERYAIKFCFKL